MNPLARIENPTGGDLPCKNGRRSKAGEREKKIFGIIENKTQCKGRRRQTRHKELNQWRLAAGKRRVPESRSSPNKEENRY